MRFDWLCLCTGGERLKGEDGKKAHPTQKPGVALVPLHHGGVQSGRHHSRPVLRHRHHRCGGTRLGRHFVGLEREASYAAIARKRIAEIEPLSREDVAPMPSKRAEPRIPFARADRGGAAAARHAVERSQRPPSRPRAPTAPSSSNALGEHRGSIHQVGAAVQGAPACNGWTFCMSTAAGGAKLPIDHLRQQVRAGL